MKKLTSLEDVNALALPAKVLVLLSKYAQTLKSSNGTIIKLSSLRVFMHVHQTCVKANDAGLNIIYHQMLDEVNQHINAGTMFTNKEKKMLLKESKNKQRTLKKYLVKGNFQKAEKEPNSSRAAFN